MLRGGGGGGGGGISLDCGSDIDLFLLTRGLLDSRFFTRLAKSVFPSVLESF